jgi:hypothetical protein
MNLTEALIKINQRIEADYNRYTRDNDTPFDEDCNDELSIRMQNTSREVTLDIINQWDMENLFEEQPIELQELINTLLL